jgi:GNAT superfamily N-acetyltransferase
MKAAAVALQRAEESDSERLSEIAVRAFHTCADYGGQPGSGPPGYDSPDAQVRFMKHCDYYKILLDGAIVGALLVARKGRGHCECVGIWVDPDHQRRGIARRAFELAFAAYPDARRWTAETPLWDERTAQFYPAIGFRKVGEHGEDALYEMRVGAIPEAG